mgnify:CR=1 FL=1
MKFDDEIVYFNIFETMKYPPDSNVGSVFSVTITDPAIRRFLKLKAGMSWKLP